MTDVNINTTATPESLAQNDSLIEAMNEPSTSFAETLEQKVARLEAQLAEARKGNLKVPLESPDGTLKPYTAVRDEHREFLDEMALAVESSRVQREEIERRSHLSTYGQTPWQPAGYAERPLMTEDEAIKEFGLAKWNTLTAQQRAQAKTVTQAMVDRVDLQSVFGRTSSGKKAMALSSQNPALYRLAKRKAKDEGLI